MNRKILRSIVAIVAGFIVVAALSTLTDTLLEKLHVFPIGTLYPTWMLALALLYRCAYTVLGGYVAARIALTHPMGHVMILGIIGTVAGTIGAIVGWNLSAHWYPIAIAVTAFPLTWLGGTLRKERTTV
jgi:hypothetical protein